MILTHLFVHGINPEPWRSPSLGITRRNGRAQPAAYKDENLRSYQEALHEVVFNAIAERAEIDTLPVYPKGEQLAVSFAFWRQLDTYSPGTGGRKNVRQRPDVTNLIKAAEDALQGVLYHDDKANRLVNGELVAVGPDVEPGIIIVIRPWVKPTFDTLTAIQERHGNNVVADKSKTVWIARTHV